MLVSFIRIADSNWQLLTILLIRKKFYKPMHGGIFEVNLISFH